jgi:hypothetical protein
MSQCLPFCSHATLSQAHVPPNPPLGSVTAKPAIDINLKSLPAYRICVDLAKLSLSGVECASSACSHARDCACVCIVLCHLCLNMCPRALNIYFTLAAWDIGTYIIYIYLLPTAIGPMLGGSVT